MKAADTTRKPTARAGRSSGALTPMLKFLIEHEGLSKKEADPLREFVRKTGRRKDK